MTIESRPPETASIQAPPGRDSTAPSTRSTAARDASLREVTRIRYRHRQSDSFLDRIRSATLEHSAGGPLGTLIAGLGMGGYYIGLVWINMLLGLMLTPFFIMPLAWVQDARNRRKAASATDSSKA